MVPKRTINMGPSNGSSTLRVPVTPSDMFPYISHFIPSNTMGVRNAVDPQLFFNGGSVCSMEANTHDITTISQSFNDIHQSVHREVGFGHTSSQDAVNVDLRHFSADDIENSSLLGNYVAPAPDPLHESNTSLAISLLGNEQVAAPVPSTTVESLTALGNRRTLPEFLDLGGMGERRIQGGTMLDGYQCKWQGCKYNRSFSRPADLVRHVKTVHVSPHSYICPARGCDRTFNRKDNLLAHVHRLHRDGFIS